MKVKDLKQKLASFSDDLEVVLEVEELNCPGHEPGEYCYCGYKKERKKIHSLHEETKKHYGKVCKKIVIETGF